MTSSLRHISCPCLLCQVVLGFLSEADYKLVAKAIRHRVTAIKHQREKQQSTPDPNQTATTCASAADTCQVREMFPRKQDRKFRVPTSVPANQTAAPLLHVSTWSRLHAGHAHSVANIIGGVVPQQLNGFWDQQPVQQERHQ